MGQALEPVWGQNIPGMDPPQTFGKSYKIYYGKLWLPIPQGGFVLIASK